MAVKQRFFYLYLPGAPDLVVEIGHVVSERFGRLVRFVHPLRVAAHVDHGAVPGGRGALARQVLIQAGLPWGVLRRVAPETNKRTL